MFNIWNVSEFNISFFDSWMFNIKINYNHKMFGLITWLIWVDPWIVKLMASGKNAYGNRLDVGWQYGIDIDKNSRKVLCKYCQKIISGGIFRFKQHLACTRKDVEPCQQVSQNVKQMILSVLVKNLEATEKKRKAHQYSGNDDDDDEIKEISSKDKGKTVASGSGSTQTTLNQLLKKDIKEKACRQIARFFYTSVIPFNCVKNPEFIKALEMVAKHGPGFKQLY